MHESYDSYKDEFHLLLLINSCKKPCFLGLNQVCSDL